MKKSEIIKTILLFLVLILMFFLFLKNTSDYQNGSEENRTHNFTNNKNNLSDEAPDLDNKFGKWINTDKNLTMKELKGKVVLIEFWTFGCYNCTNTIPYLNKWYEKYRSDDFEMIGIHCPEFDNERNFENVKANVEKLGIKNPVLTDNEFSVWSKYNVDAWPTIFLIDKKGEIRYKKIGEGKYDRTEQVINELLNENYSTGKEK